MKRNKENLIQTIRQSLLKGSFVQAKELLSRLKRLSPHNWTELAAISQFHLWLGEVKAAFQVLGPVYSKEELGEITDSAICIQIRLAFMLGYIGAHNLALRQFEILDEVIAKKRIDIQRVFPKYFQIRGNAYLAFLDLNHALLSFQKSLEVNVGGSETYQFSKIALCDCLVYLDRIDEAIEHIDQLIEEIERESADVTLLAISYQAKGEYLLFANRLREAKEALDHSAGLFPIEIQTKDKAILHRTLGAYDVLVGEMDRAQQSLVDALTIFKEKGGEAISCIATYYWLEQVPGFELPLESRIALRCHPNVTFYSTLVGSQVYLPSQLPKWYTERKIDLPLDCWLIISDRIEGHIYNEVAFEGMTRPVLDIYSATFLSTNETSTLPILQARCLALIVGSGDLGISLWLLMDLVYEQDFYTIESGTFRIKQLVRRIAKQFHIELQGNRYFFRRPKDWSIILPADLRPQ